MLIKVAVKQWYDWTPVRKDEVRDGDITVPSVLGPDFVNKQIIKTTPSVTTISIPDGEIDRMVEDHKEGMRMRGLGYVAKHVGKGGPHKQGAKIDVASQPAAVKNRKQLIGDHLAEGVMPFHAPPEAIGKVKVLDAPGFSEAERRDLERYLNVRLGG